MFAALTVARLREAVYAADADDDDDNTTAATTAAAAGRRLRDTPSWISPDDIAPTVLPLATAAEKVLASMHDVLERTVVARNEELARIHAEEEGNSAAAETQDLPEEQRKAAEEKKTHLRETKAAEIRLVRNVELLKNPATRFKAEELVV